MESSTRVGLQKKNDDHVLCLFLQTAIKNITTEVFVGLGCGKKSFTISHCSSVSFKLGLKRMNCRYIEFWKLLKWLLKTKIADFLFTFKHGSLRLFCAPSWDGCIYQISCLSVQLGSGLI